MKSKVIVKISGGLGNQLFQFVFVRYLQKVLKREISIDLSEYNVNGSVRQFELSNLDIVHNVSSIESKQIEISLQELIWTFRNPSRFDPRKAFNVLLQFFKDIAAIRVFPHIKWGSKISIPIIQLPIQHLFIGNWQEPRFLQYLGNELSDEFELKRITMIDFNGPLNFDDDVALHVRRGDYLEKDSIHTVLSLEYYSKAIAIFEKDQGVANFIIFSDDPEWCRLNIRSKKNIRFFSDLMPEVSLTDELLYFMSFKRKVISNSTFSLFPALLSRRFEEKVVAPNSWFKNLNSSSPKSFYSQKWVVI
jgi:hypothetical protein